MLPVCTEQSVTQVRLASCAYLERAKSVPLGREANEALHHARSRALLDHRRQVSRGR